MSPHDRIIQSSSRRYVAPKITYALIITFIASKYCLAAGYENFFRNGAMNSLPGRKVFVCSSDFDLYKHKIEAFAQHFHLPAPQVDDTENEKVGIPNDTTTIAFMGDPTKSSAKDCLKKLPSLDEQVSKAVHSFADHQIDIPGVKKIDRDNPLSSGSQFCTMTQTEKSGVKIYYTAISVGGLDCSDDFAANLFSFTRTK